MDAKVQYSTFCLMFPCSRASSYRLRMNVFPSFRTANLGLRLPEKVCQRAMIGGADSPLRFRSTRPAQPSMKHIAATFQALSAKGYCSCQIPGSSIPGTTYRRSFLLYHPTFSALKTPLRRVFCKPRWSKRQTIISGTFLPAWSS